MSARGGAACQTLATEQGKSAAEAQQVEPACVQAELPLCAQLGPYAVPVVEGQAYRWCSCGLSTIQPWCDDAHIGTGIEPIVFVAPITETFYMCGCKRSENAPYCFGNCRGHAKRASPSAGQTAK